MAMTQPALLFMGGLAVLATYGVFYRFGDRWTNLLVEFGAAMLWGGFALSSMDVIVRDTSFASASESITPLVYLGIGMALLCFLYALFDLFESVSAEATETDLEGFGK